MGEIDHPPYYNIGKVEVIDFIEDQKFGFNLGNAVKYVCRAGIKNIDTEVSDLHKALWYINREIKRLEDIEQ